MIGLSNVYRGACQPTAEDDAEILARRIERIAFQTVERSIARLADVPLKRGFSRPRYAARRQIRKNTASWRRSLAVLDRVLKEACK